MLPNGVQKPADIDPKTHKYGFLAKVPLLPRPFSDMYSSASAHFEMGDELGGWNPKSKAAAEFEPRRGVGRLAGCAGLSRHARQGCLRLEIRGGS